MVSKMSRTTGILLTSIVALMSLGVISCDREAPTAETETPVIVPSDEIIEADSSEELTIPTSAPPRNPMPTAEDLQRALEIRRLWEQQQPRPEVEPQVQ